ncbi:hypothetical protein DWV91_11265 [Enterococcus asini]|nr:hypothetical protein DWV91_11265 [Enterococcus asini]
MKTYLYRKKQESFRAPKRDGEIRFFFILDDPENDPEEIRLLKTIKNKKSQNPVLQGFCS